VDSATQKKSRFKIGSKISSIILSAALLATTFTGLGSALSTSVDMPVSAASYGLASKIEDGNILHCFDWKLSDIKEALPGIAEAGFTSVQTSPLQGHNNTGTWFWLYQPTNFSVGNELGSYQDLKDLCAEADKYGIKVIVDVVANHLAGWNDGRRADTIDSNLNRDDFFHNQGAASNWNDRNEIIYKNIGMPDLASENETLQGVIFGMINSMKEAGVDGIRWDAAKHIGLPSEGCSFWKNVAALGMYNYGEILDGPAGGDTRSDYNGNLMKEYGSYIGVTDANYSGDVTGSIRDGKTTDSTGLWASKGVASNRLVYWAESHDTYANDPPPKEGGWTKYLSEDIMDRAYAVVAARASSQALYLSRPFEKEKTSINYGAKGSTHYTEKQVAEVNKFHNAMVGTKEYLATAENCFVVCRGGGAVVVNAGGGSKQVTVPNGGGLVPDGTYTDKVGGGTWTVSGGNMTGTIGDKGIAVFYNGAPDPDGSVSLSPASGSFTDTMTVTLNCSDVTNATYTTSEGDSGSFTNGKTITIGKSASAGSTITVNLSATGKNGTVTAKGTYTKKDPSATVTVNVDNSVGNWSNVYAYVYKGEGTSATSMSKWPGTKMTKNGDYYTLDVTGFEDGKAIFSDGTDTPANRYPADKQPGLSIGGSSKLFTMPNKWVDLPTPVPPEPDKPTITPSKASGSEFTNDTMSLTLTLKNASGGTYCIDDGVVKTFTGTSVTFDVGEGKIGNTNVTVKATAKGTDGTTVTETLTYKKKYVVKTTSTSASLSKYYSTNGKGKGAKKTITVDGDISDWDSSMIIAQGTANDDPRVYRPCSMFELPFDLYALYGAYDDNNIYLMWEMTNVQDAVASPDDNYPLSQGILYQTQNVPFLIAISTGKSDKIGNKGQTAAGENLWGLQVDFSNPEGVNRFITVSTNGANGPFIYGGDSSGVNPVEIYGPKATATVQATGTVFKYGLGILSKEVYGLDGAYGDTSPVNPRKVGDMCNDSGKWVDFNTKGHASATMDFHYEMSIPLSELGITANDVASSGVGVMVVATGGLSGLDCLPYDLTMNDNADLDDGAASLPENSFEKSDKDNITVGFARIGAGSTPTPDPDPDPDPTTPLQVNFGTDRSAPQSTTTSLTIKAEGMGGTAPYTYEFSIDNKVVKSASSTATYTWASRAAGKHTLKCVIKDSTGTTATATRTFTAEGTNPDPDPDPLANTSKVSATSINKGSSVKVTCSSTGGTGSKKYAVYYKKASASDWTTAQSYSSTTTVTITPKYAEVYTIRVKVKDGNGTVKSKDLKVTVISGLTNTSKLSASTVALGSAAKVTFSSTGGTGTKKYAVWYKQASSSTWTQAQDYKSNTYVTFTPKHAGKYDVSVKVKDGAGTIVKKALTLTVNAKLANTSKLAASTVVLGSAAKVTFSSTGGTGTKKYAVWYKQSSASSWTQAQDYKTTTAVSFTPKHTGKYDVSVKVKDGAGTIVKKALTLTVNAALANTSKLASSTVVLGSAAKVICASTGGIGTKKYAVWYKQASATSWTQAQDYKTTTTVSFTPKHAGKYDVSVKVKDGAGTIVKKALTLTGTAPLRNTSTISATTITQGKSVKVSFASTGGTGTKKYAVWYKKSSSSDWTQVQDYKTYSEKSSVSFTPKSTGKYDVSVKVKDGADTIVKKAFTVTVKSGALANTSTISATSINIGKSVTVTCASTGGTGTKTYAVWYKQASASEWTQAQAYKTNTSVTFTPKHTGKYDVSVKVKDGAGTIVKKAFTVTVNKVLNVTLKANSSSVTLGNSVTVTATPSYATGTVQYQFSYMKIGSSSWTTAKSYSTTAKASIKLPSKGNYSIRVTAKDDSSKTATAYVAVEVK